MPGVEPTPFPVEAHRDHKTGDLILAKRAGGSAQLWCEAGGFPCEGAGSGTGNLGQAWVHLPRSPYLLEAPLAAGMACGTAGGSHGGGLIRPWPTPALCKAAQVASAALGGLSPRSYAGCSMLFRAAGVQAEQGPSSSAALRWADVAPLPSQLPSMRSSSIFFFGQGVRKAPGQPPGKEPPWLAELPTVSLKARWEVGEGRESQAWHNTAFKVSELPPPPGAIPARPRDRCKHTNSPRSQLLEQRDGKELPGVTAGAACPCSDASLLRQLA